MQRRSFAKVSLSLAATSTGAFFTRSMAAQTPDASPSASPTAAGIWESADDPITIEYDTDFFGDAVTSGVKGEWCVLQIPDIDRFMSVMIKLEEDLPGTADEARDFVENDAELDYPLPEFPITRLDVVENNDAFGALYTVENTAAMDTWAYVELIPAEDEDHRPIEILVQSRRSKLDRKFHEAALNSLKINGDLAIRAIDIADLFDQVEALEVEEEA